MALELPGPFEVIVRSAVFPYGIVADVSGLGTQKYRACSIASSGPLIYSKGHFCVSNVLHSLFQAMPQITSQVLIVEDEAIFRSLLRDHLQNFFQACNVLEASDGEKGWEQFRTHRPEFCIVDLRLPKLSGEMLINLMQSEPTPPRILVLTGQTLAELPDIVEKTDKLFFVEKMAPLEKLNEALSVLFHFKQSEPWKVESNSVKPGPPHTLDQLTRREKSILGMVGEGKSSESIAELLGISVHTVRTHRRNLMQKLRIRTCAVLVRYALSSGLTGK